MTQAGTPQKLVATISLTGAEGSDAVQLSLKFTPEFPGPESPTAKDSPWMRSGVGRVTSDLVKALIQTLQESEAEEPGDTDR